MLFNHKVFFFSMIAFTATMTVENDIKTAASAG